MNLFEAITRRHSVRTYIDRPIEKDLILALNKKIERCNTVGKLHIQLILNEPKAFKGILAYGKFHGVRNYFVMAGQKASDLDERIGYYGELLVLYAQCLGLNTCWAGLSYKKINGTYILKKGEKIACYIALGYGKVQGHSHKIKSIEQVSNASSLTPDWFNNGVKAALLAPTAINQQKWSFKYIEQNNNDYKVTAKKGYSLIGYTRMDLGIAKLHFEIGSKLNKIQWI